MKRLTATIAVMLSGLVVGSCTADRPAEPEDTRVGLVDLQAEPRADVANGGTLTLATAGLPANWNPVHVDGAVGTASQILAPTQGSAVRHTADGSWAVDERYAESITQIDADPLTIEVKLNPDAVWQDGTPITSRDMVAYARAVTSGDHAAAASAVYDDVEKVVARGEFAYRVEFERRNHEWPAAVYPALPASVSGNATTFNEGFIDRAVPSNGPFLVDSIDGESGTITLARNPQWWGDTPKLEKIVWRIADPALQGEAWKAGELDVVEITDQNAEVVGDDDVRAVRGRTWSQVTINSASAPFNDVRVRRAIAKAIDPQAFADQATEQLGVESEPMAGTLRVPGQVGGTASVAERDVAGAKELLAAAGVDGLEVEIPVQGGRPASAERARLLGTQLEDIGITVTTVEVKDETFFTDVIIPLDFQLATFVWEGEPFPVTPSIRRFTPRDSNQNFTGIASPEVAQAFNALRAELGADARLEREAALEELIADQASIIPLAVAPEAWAVNPSVVNLGPTTFRTLDWTRVGFAAPAD